MKVDILDLPKLIDVNNLQEISEPKILTSGMSFHPKGLLSNEIFGYSSKDRQTTFAYIDLHGHYIHPLIYKEIFMKSMKIAIRVIDETERVSVKNGKLVPDPNGWTGIEQLYKHWDEITTYGASDQSIGNVITPYLSRKDIFITKFIVIPPFYHDADVNSTTKKVKVSELTSMYSKLINDVQFKLSTKTSFSIVSSASTMKIQSTIVDIYLFLESQICKKRGYIRRRLLSKKIDYGIRSVLTAPSYTGKDVDLDTLKYDTIYIPISLLTSAAYPFIIKFIKDYFVSIRDHVTFKPPHGTISEWDIYRPDEQFDLQYVETLISNYNKFVDIRFKPIKMKIEHIVTGEISEVEMLEEKTFYKQDSSDVDRVELTPVTSTDICFRACYDSCYDRYAMFTRYPVLNIYGIFYAKIDVISTNHTIHVQVNNKEYEHYPDIKPTLSHEKMASQFINTVKFSIARLEGLEHTCEPSKRIELLEVA